MNISKVAKVLGALVIVGLLIFAVISLIIPNLFEYITCAFKAILSGSSTDSGIGECAEVINLRMSDD